MTINRKFSVVFITFIILPLLLALLNWYFSDYNHFRWGYDHANQVSIMALWIIIAGSLYILILNYRMETPTMFIGIFWHRFFWFHQLCFYMLYILYPTSAFRVKSKS